LAARLMGEGFNVAVVSEPLGVGAREFPRGSYIARVGRNRAALHERIDALAREAGVGVHAAATAFAERGPTGTGSETTRTLNPPRIAVLAGEGVGIASYGALWFELERRIGQPFTAVRAADASRAALDHFDVIVLPAGSSYGRKLGETGAERLHGWVERGGTLIAYGGGARWVQDAEPFSETYVAPDTASLPADSALALRATLEAVAAPQAQLPPAVSPDARPDQPEPVPGSFLRALLDPTHWLTFGYTGPELAVLAESLPLRASRAGQNPVSYAAEDQLVISGWSWPANTMPSYAGGSYATVDAIGDGRVILFAEDPLYRGVFDAPKQLLYNALLLGAPARAGAAR
ncbi:MAG: hypothetical protein ACRELD_16165, partial [Longimicrobiales bacterium]